MTSVIDYVKFNKETDNYEYYMGEYNYMVIPADTIKTIKIDKKNINKLSYNKVLNEMTNKTQKILTKKLNLFRSEYVNNTWHDWYVDYYKKEIESLKNYKTDIDFVEKVVKYTTDRHSKTYNEIMGVL